MADRHVEGGAVLRSVLGGRDRPDRGPEPTRRERKAPDDRTRWAQERLSPLSFACIAGIAVAVHIGCSRGLLNAYCPSGKLKVIHDTWDKTKTLTIDCDLLQNAVCGVGAASAAELMREACLIPWRKMSHGQ